jgi:hypothetical protein
MLRIAVCLALVAVGCGGGSATDNAFTDFVTVDEALIELDCFPIQLPLDAGECETPLATLDELALTPHCWPASGTDAWGFSTIEGLEALAARVSNRVVAEPVVYERILRDMGALRALWPGLGFVGSYFPGAFGLVIETDRDTLDQMRRGNYDAWDCLNTLFRVTEIRYPRWTMLYISFAGTYDLQVLAAEYEKLPAVQRAKPDWFAGDWGDVCVTPGPDEWNYVFEEASGDCASGYIDHTYHHFVTLATGEVKRDGIFKYHHDAQRPDWFTKYVTKAVCH